MDISSSLFLKNPWERKNKSRIPKILYIHEVLFFEKSMRKKKQIQNSKNPWHPGGSLFFEKSMEKKKQIQNFKNPLHPGVSLFFEKSTGKKKKIQNSTNPLHPRGFLFLSFWVPPLLHFLLPLPRIMFPLCPSPPWMGGSSSYYVSEVKSQK